MLMKSLTQVGAGWFWTDPPAAPPRCGPPSCATARASHILAATSLTHAIPSSTGLVCESNQRARA